MMAEPASHLSIELCLSRDCLMIYYENITMYGGKRQTKRSDLLWVQGDVVLLFKVHSTHQWHHHYLEAS